MGRVEVRVGDWGVRVEVEVEGCTDSRKAD